MPKRSASRRDILQGLGAILGSAAVVQVAGASNALEVAIGYEPVADTLAKDGRVFSRAQLAVLRDVCAQVIPATDTPGAAEVDVHGFIDNQLYCCHGESEQSGARAVLDALERESRARHGLGFADLDGERQLRLLTELEQSGNGFDDEDRRGFKLLKNLVVFGYFTSEVGATQELAYDPVPGSFQGSVPYARIGRAWFR